MSIDDCGRMTQEELRGFYFDYLFEEGYSPRIDGDGDIQFKFEGKSYYIIPDASDPIYFHMYLPAGFGPEKNIDDDRLHAAAAVSTALTKVAKVVPDPGCIRISVEMFVPSPQDVKVVFRRSLSVIDTALKTFVMAIGSN
jgi:hypothetical protein